MRLIEDIPPQCIDKKNLHHMANATFYRDRACWSRSAESSHVGKLRGVGVEGTTTMSSSDVVIIELK